MIQNTGKIKNQRGFTMIEVISVLLIIAIIAVVAVVRLSNTSSYDLASQLEVLKTHLRLAQTRAMSASSPWGICFSSSTTYYMFEGEGSTTPVPISGENSATVDLTTKKSALSVTSTATIPRVTFNAYGSPGNATLTITTNGGDITVTKNTGFIP
ncbi:type iv pilin pila [hydrocarbon metagenome]|uniref:Type iv pilin pila n=1 Tax=hydrocarbon metagenome TaxID=938273 RepID=A0A0W8FL52_9ZZZZ